MNNLVLVDTNILIYAIDADSQFHERALKFLSNDTLRFFTTSKNISEFLVILTRNEEIDLSSAECLEILNSLLANVTIFYLNPTTFKVFQDLVRKYNPRDLWVHDIEIASIGVPSQAVCKFTCGVPFRAITDLGCLTFLSRLC